MRARPRIDQDYLKPSPVTITRGELRPIRWETERKRKLRQWEHGVPSYSSLFVGWGRVTIKRVGKDQRPFTQIHTAAGVYTVRWFAGVVPPEVKSGSTQVVVGRIGTMSMGTEVFVSDALVIGENRGSFRMSLTKLFKRYTAKPKSWMDWPDEWRKLTEPPR